MVGGRATRGAALIATLAAASLVRAEGPPRGVFAVEDTLDVPAQFRMSPIEVRADRLRIGDIVARCMAREREMQERIRSHEFTMVSRTVFTVRGRDGKPARQQVVEQVERRFLRAPDEDRTAILRREQYRLEDGERKPWEEDDDVSVEVDAGDLNDLPFYLEDRDAYDFRILSREIVGDRVIYEVRLTPRSDFEIAPGGTIWVDTSTFSILREEFDFGDRVPLPLFLAHIGPFVRERERVGDVWVWKRMLIRVELRAGWLRRLDADFPDTAEFVVTFSDHRVNEESSLGSAGEGG